MSSFTAQVVKNPPALQVIPELGRSPEKGNDNPLQYSCLENSLDRGAWWAIVHGVAELDTTDRLNAFTLFHFLPSSFACPSSSCSLGKESMRSCKDASSLYDIFNMYITLSPVEKKAHLFEQVVM